MDRSIERIRPQARILAPKRQEPRSRSRRFVIDGEARPEVEDEADLDGPHEERPVGRAGDDEAGVRLDLTA